MAGLDPAIPVFCGFEPFKTWMPGTSPGMTSFFLRRRLQTHVFAPRRDAPGLLPETSAPKTEGVGNAGRPMHPQPRVRILVASMHTSIHSEPSEITRHSRTQWFTAYTVLSPVIGFLATVIPEKLASQELDAGVEASGPHDFAVRYQRFRQMRR